MDNPSSSNVDKGQDDFLPLSLFVNYVDIYEHFRKNKTSMDDAFQNPNTLYNILTNSLKTISITKEDRSKLFQMNKEIVHDFRQKLTECGYDLIKFRNTKRKWLNTKIEWPTFTSFNMENLIKDGQKKVLYRYYNPAEKKLVKNKYFDSKYTKKYRLRRVRTYYDLYHFLRTKKNGLVSKDVAFMWLHILAMSKCPEMMEQGEIDQINQVCFDRTTTFINQMKKSNGKLSQSEKTIIEFKWPKLKSVDLNDLMSNYASMSEMDKLVADPDDKPFRPQRKEENTT